jgi:hypothetical protein
VLPYTQNSPALGTQLFGHQTVTLNILAKLPFPENAVVDRNPGMLRALMPKTPVHKHHQSFLAKNEVRSAENRCMSAPAGYTVLSKKSNQAQFCTKITTATD